MRRIRSPPLVGQRHGVIPSTTTTTATTLTCATTTTTRTATFLRLSLAVNLFLLLYLTTTWWKNHTDTTTTTTANVLRNEVKLLRHENIRLPHDVHTWHGGHPAAQHQGSCWCNHENNNNNNDTKQYCMCTPNVAIDLIVLSSSSSSSRALVDHSVWLARRKDTGQYATIGGFVMLGESVEQAVFRELQEETGLTRAHMNRPPTFLGVYSDPQRDNRRHTVSVVYAIHVQQQQQQPVANDDVKELTKVPWQDIEKYSDFFADHQTILLDYRQRLLLQLEQERGNNSNPGGMPGGMVTPLSGVFPANVHRSICNPF